MNAPVATPLTGEIIHEDGIWFGLEESEYHADRALGSSDLKLLLGDPAAYWWDRLGPGSEDDEKDTDAKKLGRAVHRLVLEGPARFEACYGRAIHDGKTKAGKEESAEIAEAGKERLVAKIYDRARAAGTVIRANPHIASAFTAGMPEVSVFWTDEIEGMPVRRKARFDFLRIRAIVDLKSCAPYMDWTFRATALRAIRYWRYGIQAAAYTETRRQIPRLVREGRVFGAPEAGGLADAIARGVVPADWLERVAAQSEADDGFAFVFVFWASSGAPLTWAGSLSPGNSILEHGRAEAARAMSRFVECMREFGSDVPWLRPHPLEEISVEEVDQPWRANDAA